MIAFDDRARLRRGAAADLEAVLAIKRALPMPGRAETREGGFLLGSDPATYGQLLALGRGWLLELAGGEVVGFTLTLTDAMLRASPLWARREQITWTPGFDPEPLLDRRIAYFDQLAVLPKVRRRWWSAALALHALDELIDELEHALVLTTTVREPIANQAALPYLARVGARQVGLLDEHYPEVGRIVSAVHLVEAPRYRERLKVLAGGGPGTRRAIEAAVPRLGPP